MRATCGGLAAMAAAERSKETQKMHEHNEAENALERDADRMSVGGTS
jgi:hypothetical protein